MAQVNFEDKYLYEHLSFIIQEFEEAALKSNKREGLLVVANSPLLAMDQVLESSSKALRKNRTKKINKSPPAQSSSKTVTDTNNSTVFRVKENESTGVVPQPPEVTLNTEAINEQTSVDLIGGESAIDLSSIELDDDLKNLVGSKNLQDFLKDCLNCDLRVSFDWQLKPIDLLGPIGELVKDINLSIDNFEKQMNPFTALEDLCDILNGTHWLCLPDLMSILMALKLLFKSYLSFQFSISIDWTVIIGPLLKVILDAIASLIQAIAGVLLGPLDCVEGALKTVAEVEKQMQQTLEAGLQVADRVQIRAEQASQLLSKKKVSLDSNTDIDFNVLLKDIGVTEGKPGNVSTKTSRIDGKEIVIPELTTPDLPEMQTRIRKEDAAAPEWTQWSFPSGIALTDKVTLPDAIKDPRFSASHWTTKVILSVGEAKKYVLELVRKIIGSVNSLKGLISGGLGIQLGNLGLLLFVKDMIALIILIMKLLQSNKTVKDWCAHLENHPEVLEEMLGETYSKVAVSKTDKALILIQGPQIVGRIKTCATETTGVQQNLLNQWIQDLQRGT